MASVLGSAVRIAAKDISIELRTRTAFMSALVFAILVLAILFFARDPTAVSAIAVAPGALWVTFTFAAMIGLNRAFLLEKENGAIDGLILTGVPKTGIFIGKALGNLAFVFVVEAVSLPLFVLFYNLNILPQLPGLILVIVLATVAFVSVGTLLSSMVVRTRFAELMLPLLLLPFLVPPIISAVQATSRLLGGRPLSEVSGWLNMLVGFDVAFVTLSILLFEATLSE